MLALKLHFLFLLLVAKSCQIEISLILNKDEDTFKLEKGFNKNFVAHAHFEDAINSTGFSFLEIQSNSTYQDDIQAYAAGFVEGVSSKDLIETHWSNIMKDYCAEPPTYYCQKLQMFLEENFKWMAQQIAENAHKDPFWHQVHLVLLQQQGLVDGLNLNLRNPSIIPFLKVKPEVTGPFLLLFTGELGDFENVVRIQSNGKIKPKVQFKHKPSCSAFIKLTPNNEDLLISQNTWNSYSSMLRTLKKYTLPFHTIEGQSDVVPAKIVSFSSYPGLLFSLDDFYLTSTGLAVQETSLVNYNDTLWKLIKPESVGESIRNIVANRLATGGKDWVELFSRHNSGTYNNQWMVLDYKRFTPGAAHLRDGLLHIAEQLPGVIVAADATAVLGEQSYWSSYNSPFFGEIFNKSDTASMVDRYGDWFRYEKTPRALIFKRDHHKVADLKSMERLMRYNGYEHDPFAACSQCIPPYSAENAIAARSDLNPKNGVYPFPALGHKSHGAIDFKATSWKLSQLLRFLAVSGPTNDQVPTFKWSESPFGDTEKHQGHPDVWDFKSFVHEWRYL